MPDNLPPEQFRLFVAINIPEPVKTEIEKAQAELRAALPERCIRWTRREQFHLTLKFLGNVEARGVPELTQAIALACRGFAALSLRAERIGFFPHMRSPRVIW